MEIDKLPGNLKYTHITCKYVEEITQAAQKASKSMFKLSDIRRAMQEQHEGFDITD